jgi:hypothetical protein
MLKKEQVNQSRIFCCRHVHLIYLLFISIMFTNKVMQVNGFQSFSFRLLSRFTRKSQMVSGFRSLSTANNFHTSRILMVRSNHNSWDRKLDTKPRFAGGRKQPVSDANIFSSMDGDIKEDSEKYQNGPSMIRRPSNRRSVRGKGDSEGFVHPREERDKLREESSSSPAASSSSAVYQRYGESIKDEETNKETGKASSRSRADEADRSSYDISHERNFFRNDRTAATRERKPSKYASSSSTAVASDPSFSMDDKEVALLATYGNYDNYKKDRVKRREQLEPSRSGDGDRTTERKERRTETASNREPSEQTSWKQSVAVENEENAANERPLFSRRPEMHRDDNYRARSSSSSSSSFQSRDSSFPSRNDYRRENNRGREERRGEDNRRGGGGYQRSRSESFNRFDRRDGDRRGSGNSYERRDRGDGRRSSSSFPDRTKDYRTRDSRGKRLSYSSNNDRYDQRDSATYQQRRSPLGQEEYQQQQEQYRLEASSYMKDYDGDNLYGISAILAALTAGKRTKFDELLIQEGFTDEKNHKEKKDQPAIKRILSIIEEKKVLVKEVSKHVLNIISDNRPHQGFILRTKPLQYPTIKTLPVTADDR